MCFFSQLLCNFFHISSGRKKRTSNRNDDLWDPKIIDKIPIGKIDRALAGGKTAAKTGGPCGDITPKRLLYGFAKLIYIRMHNPPQPDCLNNCE